MANEADKDAALKELTGALLKVLRCGLQDYPAEVSAKITASVSQGLENGSRLEYIIRLNPIALRCYFASADLEERTLIFEIEASGAPSLH